MSVFYFGILLLMLFREFYLLQEELPVYVCMQEIAVTPGDEGNGN